MNPWKDPFFLAMVACFLISITLLLGRILSGSV